MKQMSVSKGQNMSMGPSHIAYSTYVQDGACHKMFYAKECRKMSQNSWPLGYNRSLVQDPASCLVMLLPGFLFCAQKGVINDMVCA